MNAKKIATTLGTGTLGAGGAGAAAWNFGLLGGNGLGVNGENGTDQQIKDVPPSPSGAPQAGAHQESATGNQGSDGGGGAVGSGMLYFANATSYDKKAIDSASNRNWSSTISKSGGISVAINNGKNTSDLWSCKLEAVILGFDGAVDISEFKRQGDDLVGKIKSNPEQRRRFVQNCSEARIEGEDGGVSKIYLEAERVGASGNKFKFKEQDIQNLPTKDFKGIYKLGEEEELALIEKDWTIIKEQNKVTVKKELTIVSGGDESENYKTSKKDWICSISGNPKRSNKNFKESKLMDILNTTLWEEKVSDKYEKKKYLLGNCRKNNKDIRGLEIQENGDDWEFKNLEKITEGMYENPALEKP